MGPQRGPRGLPGAIQPIAVGPSLTYLSQTPLSDELGSGLQAMGCLNGLEKLYMGPQMPSLAADDVFVTRDKPGPE